MKRRISILDGVLPISLLLTMAVPLASRAQIPPLSILPLRFGVIDITPNKLSGETNHNSEPTLGAGSGTK